MNKEQQELLDEAYKNYCKSFENQTLIEQYSFDTDPMTQFMFLNKCKTDTEFSETWGLKIEERELSLDERMQIWQNQQDGRGEFIMECLDVIPTKLITTTYNDTKLESYE